LGGFFPTQTLGPRSQEVAKGIARAMLTFGPRYFFNLHSATGAIYPPHGVEKINGDVPKWNEGKPSLRGQVVVSGTGFVTRAATRPTVRTRPDEGFDTSLVIGLYQSDGLIQKTLERMDEVE